MKPWLITVLLISAACAAGYAQDRSNQDRSNQDKPNLHARELFYTPPPDSAPPVQPPVVGEKAPPPKPPVKSPPANKKKALAVPLGLRYSVMKRNAAGRFDEIDPDTTFHSGDRIRLGVAANSTGYLYVVMQGSSGNWSLLFPTPEVADGSNLIQRGESRQIPSGDRGQFFFDQQAGAEKLFLVLSRQPEPDLDKLIYSVGGHTNGQVPARTLMAQASVNDAVVEHLRQDLSARDLVFEKVDSASGVKDAKTENAAYVVNPSSAPDARLVVDVRLTHK